METQHSAHMIWQELIAAALVGQDRGASPIPSASGNLGGVLAALATRPDPDQVLLAAAGIVSLYRRAGARPETDKGSLPEPCPIDERPTCSERSSGHLARMLSGQFREALPEWLAALARSGRRAREEDLVALLEHGRNHRGLREAIVLVLGSRGRWLAAQNIDWSYATEAQRQEGDWQTASRQWRLEELKRCRVSDPVRARELVASTWSEETPTDRAAFLETFAAGLSMGDEPLLESALDDKHAGVRRAAAELLSRLAESRLCQRMIARVGPLVQFAEPKGKLQIGVTLPDQYTKDMARESVEKKVPGMGERNGWLKQMIGVVPPSYWCVLTGKSPAELLKAAGGSEWDQVLCCGWAEASQRHREPDWLEACIEAGLQRLLHNKDHLLFDLSRAGLSDERLEPFLIRMLHQYPEGAYPLFFALARTSPHPWGEELSRTLIDSILVELRSGNHSIDARVPNILQAAGFRIPVSLLDELDQLLSNFDPTRPNYEVKAITDLLDTLRFRHEMLSELSP